MKKAMLAEDCVIEKVVYPVCVQPKIDGVRGINFDGTLRGRSLKTHKNRRLTEFYSHNSLIGFDGELVCGPVNGPDLCARTTSATSTIDSNELIGWCVFDYIGPGTGPDTGFVHRHAAMCKRREEMLASRDAKVASVAQMCWIVPYKIANNEEQLLALDAENLDAGYEGSIIRCPTAPYKHGRSTVKQKQLLRIKQFLDGEGVVVEIIEGATNTNEAKINERGLTERSNHKENKIPNGLVGAIVVRAMKQIKDPQTKKVLIEKDQLVRIGPGRMSHREREYYFLHPERLIGEVVKYKFFPKGHKDKPRFPTYEGRRDLVDM